MELSIRPKVYSLPSYSLTADLIGFLRCGLQYRYTRIGQLPSANPVQMWFGEFIHGVLEEAYRRYDANRKAGRAKVPVGEAGEIILMVKKRLSVQGLYPWSKPLEEIGDARARAAITDLGPQLFPIIHRAEVRLTGARALPLARIPAHCQFRNVDRYEMVGIVDVVTHVELNDPKLHRNQLIQQILKGLPSDPPDRFELIIDYKGMRRPPAVSSGDTTPSLWDVYAWQVQTYAHLRKGHEDSLQIIGGLILYLNELLPTWSDLEALRKEVRGKQTDVTPTPGSEEEHAFLTELRRIEGRDASYFPSLPLDFRLRRALRVVSVSDETIRRSLEQFDEVVARIETCRGKEVLTSKVLAIWEKNPEDEGTCAACDSRTFCPSYRKESSPRLPSVANNR